MIRTREKRERIGSRIKRRKKNEVEAIENKMADRIKLQENRVIWNSRIILII